MATSGIISSAGIGSGIDVNGIISKLMAVEQLPLTNLKTKEVSYQAKLTAFGTLKGAFSAFQNTVDDLNSPLLFKNMTATPSDSSVLSASANTAATAGNYSVDVQALAQGESISTAASFSSMTTNLATAHSGQIKIELGTTSGTTFTPNSGTSPITVDVPTTSSSLVSIRDAINTAHAGVTARIVDIGSSGGSGSNFKLVITSNNTGANQSLRITTWDSVTGLQVTGTGANAGNDTTGGLAQFAFDPAASATSGNEYSVNSAAQNAHIRVNNVDVYRSTNTFSDAITGVTLNLTKQGTTNLTVAKDTSRIKSAIDAFVTTYNTAAQELRKVTAYDSKTKKAQVLTGDSGARSLDAALKQMLNFSATTESSNIRSLTDLGITVQRDGTLKFDSTKLDSALQSNPGAVAHLLGGGYQGSKGIASRMSTLMGTLMDDNVGVLATSTDGIDRTIKDLQNQETALATRLVQVQANYQAQFMAMDKFVSSWNSTSSYLTQQMTALNGSGK